MKNVFLNLGLVAVFAMPFAAAASSCCDSHQPAAATASGCQRDSVAAHREKPQATSAPLSGARKTAFESYTRIQSALAKDSTENVAASAAALAKAVREDGKLPAQVAVEAEALGKAKDLAAAREAFKKVSQPLIEYAQANHLTSGAYVEVYCSMAKAGWLQTDKAVKNPYYGKSMLTCGQVKAAH